MPDSALLVPGTPGLRPVWGHDPAERNDGKRRAGYGLDGALFQRGAQLWVAAVDRVCRDPAGAVPGIEKSADHTGGQLRLGRDGVLVQARGSAAIRVARPGVRCVQLPVHRRVPAQSRVDEVDSDLRVSILPAVPVYWRWTPTVCVPFFTSPVSSITSTAPSSCRCSRAYSGTSSRTASASHRARPSRCCMPPGVASGAHSAMLQQFLRGRSDSSPSIRSRTQRARSRSMAGGRAGTKCLTCRRGRPEWQGQPKRTRPWPRLSGTRRCRGRWPPAV